MSETKKILNKKLHKFSKTYRKSKSLTSLGVHESGIYLVFKSDNRFSPVSPIYAEMLLGTVIVQKQQYGVFFMELFKYLRKYQDFLNFAHNKDGDPALIAEIKKHLLIHFQRKMKEPFKTKYKVINSFSEKTKKRITMNNMLTISHYSNFIDTCFKLLAHNSEVSLVIQKKVGYKYYENVVYV